MNKETRKKVNPGDKRNVSFPQNIDQEFLDYLNSKKNFSGALIELALKGFKNKDIIKLENRIENLEKIISKNSEIGHDNGINKTTLDKAQSSFMFDFDPVNPEDEDDDF